MAEKSSPCVICDKWPMLTPIYQCEEGHVICNPCTAGKVCLACNKKLPEKMVRCRLAESWQPPLTKCCQKGCKEIFANRMDMEEHVKSVCNFTEISLCRIMELGSGDRYVYCDTKSRSGTTYTAIDHFQKSHGAVGQVDDSAFDYRWIICDKADEARPGPGLWFIADDASVVFLQMIEKDNRRWLRVFLLGDRKAPLEMKVVVEMTFLPKMTSNGRVIRKCMESRFEMTLTTFTDDEADDFKDAHTFDAGSVLLPIGSLAIDINKGKGATRARRTWRIDSEVPEINPFEKFLKDLEMKMAEMADKIDKAFRRE